MEETRKLPETGQVEREPGGATANKLPVSEEGGAEAVSAEPVSGEAMTTEAMTAEAVTVEAVTAEEEPLAAMTPLEDTAADAGEVARPWVTIRLERKHPLAIRWMHWVNFPVLALMIWSGLCIYWNTTDNAFQHPHAIYRIGIGSFTLLRIFPAPVWNFLNIPWHVTQGLGYHFFFMWIFAINGIAYVLFLVFSGEWRFMVPEKKSFFEAMQVVLVDLHLRKGLPAQKKYNSAQRIAYTTVVLMGAGSLITGLAILKPTQLHWITTMLGGYEMARWEHFWLTMGFCGFFLIHVMQVILAGWNNFRSMVSGLEIKPVSEPSLEAERRSWAERKSRA
jgi:thiosulfate reductase cytochrome b subunit